MLYSPITDKVKVREKAVTRKFSTLTKICLLILKLLLFSRLDLTELMLSTER